MRFGFFILILLLVSEFASGQRLGANLTGLSVTAQGGEVYRVSANYNDPSGVSNGTQVQTGDYLWTPALNPGDTCRQMEIVSIVSAFAGQITVDVNANGQGAPSTQNSKVMRYTTTNALVYIPAGGSEALRECIAQYLSNQLDDVGGGTDDQTALEVFATDLGGYFVNGELEGITQELGFDVAALVSLSGQSFGTNDYGTTFTGSIIPDNATNTSALQALEIAIEQAGSGYAYYDLGNNAWAIADGTGVTFAKNTTTGEMTFTIPSGVDVKGGGWLSPSSDGDGSNDFFLILDYTGVTFNQGVASARRPVVELHNGQAAPSRASPSFKSNTVQTAITSVGSGDLEVLIDDAGSAFPNLLFTFVIE